MDPAIMQMDIANTFLGRLLLEEITPVVMVLSTPLAEESCRKNGLKFIEMLLPFSLFKKINVPVRTASDQPYRLQMFKLRLFYASDILQQSFEVTKENLKQVVHDATQKTLPDLLSEPPQLETLLKKPESGVCPSWISTFNKELIRDVSFSEHEAFDHPVACLFVVSSKDERPINRIVDLFNTDQLPSLLHDGVMDPKILKHYLLLHDNQDGTTEKATNILAEMKGTFGSNSCKLLCINSADGGDSNSKDVPWVPYGNHAALSNVVASFLSIDDLNEIKDFMQDLSSNHLIPHMEQKIRVLNQQVSATRKGFRNQIKNLWRKGKEDMPEAPTGPTYAFSSTESQIRVLGDYAFMLRDYELALSNYRLLSTDYKLDKAWKRYAGVQEMSGLSYFMLDQSRKEAEYCMENAFNTYLKVGSSGQRNATRCGLWWAEMLKARGQFKEAASIYFRIANEEPSLHAAVMLEQASYCYLLSTPPMLRKYGFHLVLAGNRYYTSDERQHAIQAYRSALLVYKEKGWGHIIDHVHFNVGRWYASLGIFEVAIKHMLEVLACTHQSLASQNLFLNDFFHIIKSMGKKFEVYKLQLPIIKLSSLKVMYEDHRTYASSSASSVSESLWQSLEEEMVPSVSTVKPNWLDAQAKSSLKKYDNSCICISGEIIKVDLEIKNPLQVPISISGVSLICELSAKSATTNSDKGASSSEEEKDFEKPPSLRDLNDGDTKFAKTKLDFVLGGGEVKKLQLEVIPKVEGVLTLVGVRWTLSDSVVGYLYFEFAAKKKQKKGRRTSHSSSRSLHFIVIKELPKLEGHIHYLPQKAFEGDLRLLMLELKNQSEHSVKNIKMKISQPRFLIPGSTAEIQFDFPQCLEKQKSSKSKDLSDIVSRSKSLLFSFPDDSTIQGGTAFSWPLWFHAGFHGKISLYLSIYYEIESSSDMTYRLLRMQHDLEVLPALDISFQIIPCLLRLQEFLVRMDILNQTNSESFYLSQLSCIGDHWEISALPTSPSICPLKTLKPGQEMSCFFKLKDCRSSSSDNLSLLQGSDLLIDSHSSKNMLLDVARSPLAEFHQHERYHQGKSKGDSSIVDFILISELRGSNSSSEPGPHSMLFCNHACHCSVISRNPISWIMDGPRMIHHDFCTSFCEASLCVTVHNGSDAVIMVRLTTFDNMPEGNQPSDAIQQLSESSGNGGWYNLSLVNDINVVSTVQGNRPRKSSMEAVSPFVWSATSSTKIILEPACTAEVPLKICIFSPGTYDLSNYEIHWKLKQSEEAVLDSDVKRWYSGSARGHPFYLTVLQASC